MPIYKAPNNDTGIYDEAPGGWIEITQQEMEEIHASRRLPEAPATLPGLTPRQIRMALSRAGLREIVEAAVAAGDQDLKDWYEFSTTFERDNPQVIAMGAALGQSSEQLDALWQLGATL